MSGRACIKLNADASCAQYGETPPGPPVGTPTVGPPPHGRLPETGADWVLPVLSAGALLLLIGLAIALSLTTWWRGRRHAS